MNIQELLIKKLGGGDHLIFEELVELFRESFGMGKKRFVTGGGDGYLKDLLERPGFMVYTAIYRDEVIGGLTAFELPLYYSRESEIYIYDIAVDASFHRKGVGRALLSVLLEDCRRSGMASVFVDADETDQHALDFYQATGGKAAKVIHFTYFM